MRGSRRGHIRRLWNLTLLHLKRGWNSKCLYGCFCHMKTIEEQEESIKEKTTRNFEFLHMVSYPWSYHRKYNLLYPSSLAYVIFFVYHNHFHLPLIRATKASKMTEKQHFQSTWPKTDWNRLVVGIRQVDLRLEIRKSDTVSQWVLKSHHYQSDRRLGFALYPNWSRFAL